jgi:predicted NBD/HSP70 family sugar kinase
MDKLSCVNNFFLVQWLHNPLGKEAVTLATTGDQHLVKRINKSIVLEKIRQESPLSRADISERTGLNKGTVSSLVGELMDDGLVLEIGTGQSSGGRKPVLLVFNNKAGYAVGVDVAVGELRIALTDLSGNIIAERSTPLRKLEAAEVVNHLIIEIEHLIHGAPASPHGIVGIGVAVPGIVNDEGIVLFAPNLDWSQVDIGAALQNRFKIPVIVDNEANAGAVGEKQYGRGQSLSDLLYVSVGAGIGVGIILGGTLYRGMTGFSGETGHTTIEINGKLCRCGNRGCWELYASEQALLEEAAKLSLTGVDSNGHDINSLLELADKGLPEATELFQRIGTYLAVGMTNMIHTFNPKLVIIGNRFAGAGRWLEGPVQREVDRRTLSFHRSGLQLMFSELGSRSAVLGAAYLVISSFFSGAKVIE